MFALATHDVLSQSRADLELGYLLLLEEAARGPLAGAEVAAYGELAHTQTLLEQTAGLAGAPLPEVTADPTVTVWLEPAQTEAILGEARARYHMQEPLAAERPLQPLPVDLLEGHMQGVAGFLARRREALGEAGVAASYQALAPTTSCATPWGWLAAAFLAGLSVLGLAWYASSRSQRPTLGGACPRKQMLVLS